ncbi:MAG: diguanylate cyclase [Variibacter sp.]
MVQPTGSLGPPGRDLDYTGALARRALHTIEDMRLPADPAGFELWYTHFSKTHPALSRALNEIVGARGQLTLDEMDALHQAHLCPADAPAQTSRLSQEIDHLIRLVDGSRKVLGQQEAGLSFVTERLEQTNSRDAIRAVARRMIELLRRVQADNANLTEALKTSGGRIAELQLSLAMLEAESLKDALTQLANRKHFDSSLARLLGEMPTAQPFSLLLLDIDHFKQFNDRHGHLLGDDVLRLVASIIHESIRRSDVAARYGGEEFAILLTDTSLEAALTVAEKMRSAIAERELLRRSTKEPLGQITVSIGAAQACAGDDPQALIGRADACLYAAKRRGRNCISAQGQEMTA